MLQDKEVLARRCTAVGVLIVALLTYLLTLEPDASYWDCPEYIAVAQGLQVGHPPGNPLWMLTARFFITLAPGNAALMVNAMSGVCAALTVMLLCLTIQRMARRLHADVLLSCGAGAVGALALCWSDSFWFSAVEAEVYAFSALCTALLFWLALVWADHATEPHADRWIVLIAYLLGLSIGVHELNLLVIPAIVLIVAFALRRNLRFWQVVLLLVGGCAGVALVLYGLIPGFLRAGQAVELITVNSWGWDFNVGLLCLWCAVIAALCAAIWIMRKSVRRWLRLCLWCLLMMFIGFSCYALIIVRGVANPPINTGAPADIFSFTSYFTREQYGKSPLFYGAAFTVQPLRQKGADGTFSRYRLVNKKQRHMAVGPNMKAQSAGASRADSAYNAALLRRGGDAYLRTGQSFELDYPPELKMWFPRLHSSAPADAQGYYNWLGVTEADFYAPSKVTLAVDSTGQAVDLPPSVTGVDRHPRRPTYLQNLQYFAVYQCGFMYWRYFFWNFVGRQNDYTGHGEPDAGNIITGVVPLDNALYDSCDATTPADIAYGNRGRNVYYFLPLILGILGIIWQTRRGVRGRRQATVVLMLFVLTGIAIVVYLNQTPTQARDRDYAFIGSYYAFAIWIGMGVPALTWILRRFVRQRWAQVCAVVLGALVPLQMLGQTADDHDRSGRTATPDMARNMLAPLPGQAVILAGEDNTLFPLWYIQQTRGLRTDVRTVSLPYVGTTWHLRALRTADRASRPLAMIMPDSLLASARLSTIFIEDTDTTWQEAGAALARFYATSDRHPGSAYPQLHTPRLYFTVGADTVRIDMRRAQGGVSRSMPLSTLATADIIISAARQGRAVALAGNAGDYVLGGQLRPYLEQVGNVSLLNPGGERLNATRTAQLASGVFRFGGASADSGVYFDPVAAHQVALFRTALLSAARQLAESSNAADHAAALRLLQTCEQEMSPHVVPYEAFYDTQKDEDGYTDEGLLLADTYITLGRAQHNKELLRHGNELRQKRLAELQAYRAYRDALRPYFRPFITYRLERLINSIP